MTQNIQTMAAPKPLVPCARVQNGGRSAMQIKAHPTSYGGTRFRSRLEATWAAFFDICGWRWQYEPLDLAGWSPDFALGNDLSLLCEVKPVALQYNRDVPTAFNKVLPNSGLCLGLGPYVSQYGPMLGVMTNLLDFGDVAILGIPGNCDASIFALGWSDGGLDLVSDKRPKGEADFQIVWRTAQNATQWRPA